MDIEKDKIIEGEKNHGRSATTTRTTKRTAITKPRTREKEYVGVQ